MLHLYNNKNNNNNNNNNNNDNKILYDTRDCFLGKIEVKFM